MDIARALRRWRRPTGKPVDQQLADLSAQVETVAQSLFQIAVLSESTMPTREQIDATAARLAEEIIKPAFEALTKKGAPAGELAAYHSLLGAHAQVAFRAKWAELERQRADLPMREAETTH